MLANKHRDDVFVSECKDGPSSGGYARMDAWVLRRSYTRPLISAYEVKVTRSDFLNDDKWPAYLDCCNALTFVCPWKMIDVTEVPENCGLMWCQGGQGGRVITKKKAPYREIEPPVGVLLYILMSRAKIVSPYDNERPTTREAWEAWLRDRSDRRDLGRSVSKKLHKAVKEANDRADAAEGKVADAESKVSGVADAIAVLERMGIDPNDSSYWIEQRCKRVKKLISAEFKQSLDSALRSLEVFKRVVEAQENGNSLP